MSERPTLALCVICHDRPDELRAALASAQGFDEVLVLDMASDPPLAKVDGIRGFRSDDNLGVTAGRNRLVSKAESDIVVFLDDDAVFRGAVPVATIRQHFARDQELGVLAFRIVRADGASPSLEYPFRGRAHDTEGTRRCSYFLGGAAAIRRSAFLAVGGFDDRYRYSTEEVDLSFSLERDGWSLLYDPAVVVEHRPSHHGRTLAPQAPALRFRNRLMLVRRHLPWPRAFLHATAWALRTGIEAGRARAPGPWLRAWSEGIRAPVYRDPLPYSLLWAIHRRGGRALW